MALRSACCSPKARVAQCEGLVTVTPFRYVKPAHAPGRSRLPAAVAGRCRTGAVLPVAEQARRHRHLPTEFAWRGLGAPRRACLPWPQLHAAGGTGGAAHGWTGLSLPAGGVRCHGAVERVCYATREESMNRKD